MNESNDEVEYRKRLIDYGFDPETGKQIAQKTERTRKAEVPGNSKPETNTTLPIWPNAMRGVPNGMLRSALFGAIKKGPRQTMKRECISSLDGIEIFYTGERLDQYDLDAWETALHIARMQGTGRECRFRGVPFLKMMGKTNSGDNLKGLYTRLMRLKANAIELRQGRYSYVGALIDEVYKDELTDEHVVVLNPKLQGLFAADQYTLIDNAVRQALTGKPLSQWLHGFYSTHAKPYPLAVATLHSLCGSESKHIRDFKKDLRKALDALVVACAANGQVINYTIVNDVVSFKKSKQITLFE